MIYLLFGLLSLAHADDFESKLNSSFNTLVAVCPPTLKEFDENLTKIENMVKEQSGALRKEDFGRNFHTDTTVGQVMTLMTPDSFPADFAFRRSMMECSIHYKRFRSEIQHQSMAKKELEEWVGCTKVMYSELRSVPKAIQKCYNGY